MDPIGQRGNSVIKDGGGRTFDVVGKHNHGSLTGIRVVKLDPNPQFQYSTTPPNTPAQYAAIVYTYSQLMNKLWTAASPGNYRV